MTPYSSRPRVLLVAAALLTGAVFLVGVQAVAMHAMPLLSPSVVTTVDLEKTFNGLEEWSQAQADETKRISSMQEEVNRRQETIATMEADLEDYPSGSDKYKEAVKKYTMEALELQGYVQFQQDRQQRRSQSVIFGLYEKIKLAAQGLADEQGYDIILVNDSVVAIPENAENVIREISSRRVLFAREQMDITVQLIQSMNADHQAATASK
jgi:Skp family chaperone for outer membrane proteins